jgi:transcriptional regulator with XRE-family HTH domain
MSMEPKPDGAAEMIISLRKALGKTQVDFARIVGIARSFLAACENAHRLPSPTFYIRLGNVAAQSNLCDSAILFWQRAGVAVDLLPSVIAYTRKSGKHRPGYRSPRTGEKRQHRMPLRIDRLPAEVKDAIIDARAAGQTWRQAAEAASTKAGQRLSTSLVQRWYDLRVEQPSKDAISKDKIVSLLEEILLAVRA